MSKINPKDYVKPSNILDFSENVKRDGLLLLTNDLYLIYTEEELSELIEAEIVKIEKKYDHTSLKRDDEYFIDLVVSQLEIIAKQEYAKGKKLLLNSVSTLEAELAMRGNLSFIYKNYFYNDGGKTTSMHNKLFRITSESRHISTAIYLHKGRLIIFREMPGSAETLVFIAYIDNKPIRLNEKDFEVS